MGVVVNQNLTFANNVQNVTKKINLLRRMIYCIFEWNKLIIYKIFISLLNNFLSARKRKTKLL